MLKDLLIQNLILMECCNLELTPNLNVITGETGSGKTAILHALKLLLGQKLDTGLIRRGASKGFIQARLEFRFPEELKKLLEEVGIECQDDSLLISREISPEGKSKNWLNERAVSLSFLQKVGMYCIQIVDQSSSEELRHADTQREILDCFAALSPLTDRFSQLFSEEKNLLKEKEKLVELERQKERELPFYISQLDELNSLQLEDGEEDLIFQEYAQVSRAEEVSSQIDLLFELISQSPGSILSKLQQAKSTCRPLATLHKSFEESLPLLETATASLQETLHLLRDSLSTFDPDPKKKETLEEKLSQIDLMKKKYGPSLRDWDAFKKELKSKIERFESLEQHLLSLEHKLQAIQSELTTLSKVLTEERTKAAKILSVELSKEINSLNMQGAQVEITVEKQARTVKGEDSTRFWLAANQGEKAALLKDSSSGGELARLLLALKLCLAEKNQTPTLIFDEIDAGVGGETARLIGEKLKKLSAHLQIICITHFPQVACEAHLHLKVQKVLEGERTYAHVIPLSHESREVELLRMLGGKKTLSFYKSS